MGGDDGGAATEDREPKLRRWVDRRPLALSVVVGLVVLLGATRADRSPPLFAAGVLGNRDVLVSVPPDQAGGAAYLEGSTVLRRGDGRLRSGPRHGRLRIRRGGRRERAGEKKTGGERVDAGAHGSHGCIRWSTR